MDSSKFNYQRTPYPKIKFPNIDASFEKGPTHIIIYHSKNLIKSFMLMGSKGKTGISNSVDASLINLNDIVLTDEMEKYKDLQLETTLVDSHVRGGEKVVFYNEKQPILPKDATEKIHNLRVEKNFSSLYYGFKENMRVF